MPRRYVGKAGKPERKCGTSNHGTPKGEAEIPSPYILHQKAYCQISQPIADAPRTAADEPPRPLTRNFALPLKILRILLSYTDYRVHDEVTSLCQTTEEHECLRRRERCEVSTRLSEHFAGKCIYVESNLIVPLCGKRHIERCDAFRVEFTQQRGLFGRCENLAAVRATPVAEQ